MGKIGSTAASAAAESGMEYASSESERLLKAGVSGAMGATVAGILGSLPKVGRTAKKIFASTLPTEEGADTSITAYLKRVKQPESQAVEDLAYNVKTQIGPKDAASKMAKVAEAAKQSKIKKTPGQTFGGDILPAKETAKAIGDASKRPIELKKVIQETEALKELDNTLDNMVSGKPAEIKKAKDALYKTLDDTPMSKDVVATVKDDPNMADILKDINSNPKNKYSTLEDNNFRKLYSIKRDIDSQLKLDKSATAQEKLKPGIADGLRESRDKFREAMKPYAEYENALRYHEQLSTRKTYMDLLDTKASKAGQKGVLSAQESYGVLFSTQKKQKAFLKDVARVGGDVEQSKAIIETLDSLRQNILSKALKKQPSATPDTGVGGRIRGVVQEWVSKATLHDYHDAVLKLNMGDTWQDDVAKVLKHPKSGDSRGFKLLELLMKVGGKVAKASNAPSARLVGSGIKTAVGVTTARESSKPEKKRQGYLSR